MKNLTARFGFALVAKAMIGAAVVASAGPIDPDLGGRTVVDLGVPVDDAKDAIEVPCGAALETTQLLWLDAAGVAGEASRLADEQGRVRREGARLTLAPAQGPALTFTDWDVPPTHTVDGESRRYVYAGRVSGWWRVEVQYGHDAPGSYFVDPGDGEVAYAHIGGRTVALVDAMIVTEDTLDEPLGPTAARLTDRVERLAARCAR